MKGAGDPHLDGIEKLRLDAVRTVVAQLDAVERVRCGDMELEQQLAGCAWRAGVGGRSGLYQSSSAMRRGFSAIPKDAKLIRGQKARKSPTLVLTPAVIKPVVQPVLKRLDRHEELLTELRETLRVQFERIAQMQVQLDRIANKT
jgi:hypothetical protein